MFAWRLVGASVRGRGHEAHGLPCQDAHGHASAGEQTTIGVVADGAGSASHSDLGAKVAVQAVITGCEGLPESDASVEKWQAALMALFQKARVAVLEAARQEVLPVRELASTLLVFVARPELIVAAQIGDGAVIGADQSGGLFAVTKPQSGEFINEVMFLTSSGAIDGLQFNLWRGAVAHVAAFTDGLQHRVLKLSDGTPHAPFFLPLFKVLSEDTPRQAEENLAEFLGSESVRKRTDDDVTLLVASLAEGHGALPM